MWNCSSKFRKLTKMGLEAADAPTKQKPATAAKPETFGEARDRSAFEAIRRHLKHVIDLRKLSTDPAIRVASSQWLEIVNEAAAK